MKKNKALKELIQEAATGLDVPADFMTGSCRIEVIANNNLLIENHRGILEYGDELMRINCGDLIIKVTGYDLELKTLNLNELSITGNILSLEYLT